MHVSFDHVLATVNQQHDGVCQAMEPINRLRIHQDRLSNRF
jgi:hypothetical protein